MIGVVLPTLPAELRSFLSPQMSRMGLIIKICMHLLASAHTGRYFIYRFLWPSCFVALEVEFEAGEAPVRSISATGAGWPGHHHLLQGL